LLGGKIFTRRIEKIKNGERKENRVKTKDRVKQKFALLTDNDLQLIEGRKEKLLGRLQVKPGKTEGELHMIFAGL
jgi:uncharacterized protein YjbJ (UPF0337 family)